ncbi:hypothetical protein ACOSP7_029566 [Xanthoceras sorbifolium]
MGMTHERESLSFAKNLWVLLPKSKTKNKTMGSFVSLIQTKTCPQTKTGCYLLCIYYSVHTFSSPSRHLIPPLSPLSLSLSLSLSISLSLFFLTISAVLNLQKSLLFFWALKNKKLLQGLVMPQFYFNCWV